jgi:hypothetical protein
MVKKLEKGSTVASLTPQQQTKTHKNRIQEKSKVGHSKSLHYPTKHKTQEPLSKKPRSSNKWRVCYKCREKGSLCRRLLKYNNGQWHWLWLARPVPARLATSQCYKAKKTSSPRTRHRSKHGQELSRYGVTNKDKSCIWYVCRQKGHMGKDCPNGNIPKSNLVHYDFNKLRNDKNVTCAMREISSPQTSMRAIWVPKHLVTNLVGPNKCWYQETLVELAIWMRCIEHMARRDGNHFWSSGHVEGKFI